MNKIAVLFVLAFQISMAQVAQHQLLKQLQNHKPKDTLSCYWLNQLIEAENNPALWIQYNNQLKTITLENLKKSTAPKLQFTYRKYLSIAYNNQGAYYNFSNQYQKAINDYKKSYAVSNAIRFYEGNALALQNIGTAYDFLGKLDSAVVYFEKALVYAKKSKKENAIAYVLTDLGYVNNNLGNNSKAIQYNLEALKIFEKQQDLEGIERTCFALGRIFDMQKDYEKGIQYYKKCIAIDQQTNNRDRQQLVLTSLANNYIDQKKYAQAQSCLDQAKKICLDNNLVHGLGNCYLLYGDIYFDQQKLKAAEANYLQAITLFEQAQNANFIGKTKIKLAKTFLLENRLEEAKKNALEGYQISIKNKYPTEIKNVSDVLSTLYEHEKDYKNALKFKQIATSIADSIYFNQKSNIALKATYQYEDEKKLAKIKALSQAKKIAVLQSERQKIFLYGIIGVSSMLILLGYFMFVRYKTKQQNHLLKMQLATFEADKKAAQSELKALRSQMNPHFIFNALNSIQRQFMFGDKILANKQMNNFTTLTRDILETSGLKQIDVATEIEILTKYLELEKMRFKDDFTYEILCSDKIDADYHQIPPMLLQPFVENSIKHGLLHQEGIKKLSVVFDLDSAEEFMMCTITDNGIGRKKSAEINARNSKNHHSFSTEAIAQRLEILKGENTQTNLLVYEDLKDEKQNDIGTKVTLRIALA